MWQRASPLMYLFEEVVLSYIGSTLNFMFKKLSVLLSFVAIFAEYGGGSLPQFIYQIP